MPGPRPGNGGKRPGAGRPKGVPNKVTKAAIEKAQATGAMPLDIILKQMRKYDEAATKLNATKGASTQAVRELEELAAERAKEAAPYLHPRLQSVTQKNVPVNLKDFTDAELEQLLPFLERIERTNSGGGTV